MSDPLDERALDDAVEAALLCKTCDVLSARTTIEYAVLAYLAGALSPANPQRIDRAARHLRETLQSGKRLTPWEATPKATKKKWLALAESTLRAADEKEIAP